MSPSAQCLSALERANEVRHARGQRKRQIRDGTLSLVDATRMDCMAGMTLEDLLMVQRRWGPDRTEAFLGLVRIEPHVLVGELTEAERARLGVPEKARDAWHTSKARQPRRVSKRVCSRCGARLKEASDSRLCGFCEAESA